MVEILGRWFSILRVVGRHEDTLSVNFLEEVLLRVRHVGGPPEGVVLFRRLSITLSPPDVVIELVLVTHLHQ